MSRDLPEAWSYGWEIPAFVAVIDAGIDFHHPDLRENLYGSMRVRNSANGVDDDGNELIDINMDMTLSQRMAIALPMIRSMELMCPVSTGRSPTIDAGLWAASVSIKHIGDQAPAVGRHGKADVAAVMKVQHAIDHGHVIIAS